MTRNDPRVPRIPRPLIVAALVRLYPSAWRSEYGAELTDVLLARPVGRRVTRVPRSTILGLAAMLLDPDQQTSGLPATRP